MYIQVILSCSVSLREVVASKRVLSEGRIEKTFHSIQMSVYVCVCVCYLAL